MYTFRKGGGKGNPWLRTLGGEVIPGYLLRSGSKLGGPAESGLFCLAAFQQASAHLITQADKGRVTPLHLESKQASLPASSVCCVQADRVMSSLHCIWRVGYSCPESIGLSAQKSVIDALCMHVRSPLTHSRTHCAPRSII